MEGATTNEPQWDHLYHPGAWCHGPFRYPNGIRDQLRGLGVAKWNRCAPRPHLLPVTCRLYFNFIVFALLHCLCLSSGSHPSTSPRVYMVRYSTSPYLRMFAVTEPPYVMVPRS